MSSTILVTSKIGCGKVRLKSFEFILQCIEMYGLKRNNIPFLITDGGESRDGCRLSESK